MGDYWEQQMGDSPWKPTPFVIRNKSMISCTSFIPGFFIPVDSAQANSWKPNIGLCRMIK
jgi:hypothetical protein